MRDGPVVVTISSGTPRSWASSLAVSTSEPAGCILSSVMPKGGIAVSIAIRTLPAFLMSSSASACATALSASRATATPAISLFIMNLLLLGDQVRQIAAEVLLVEGVQLAVLDVGQHPLVDLVEQPLLALLDADAELEVVEDELDLDLARRVLLVELRHDHLGGREDVDLAAQERLALGGIVLVAHQLHALGPFLGELGVVRRAADGADGLAVEIGELGNLHRLRRGDHRAQHGIALREVDHLGALGRVGQARDHQVGLAGLQRRNAG